MPRWPAIRVTAILLSVLCPGLAAAQGLTAGGISGAYFANGTLAGAPAFTRQDVRLSFDWNGAAPGGSIGGAYTSVPASGFSVRWTGTLVAPISGTYTFTAKSSGPATVSLGAAGAATPARIIDYTGATLASTSGSFKMLAGQPYRLVMTFENQSSPAVAELDWQAPGMSVRPVEAAVPLGVNITSLADWDGSRMFANAMRQSRGWCTLNSNCASFVPSTKAGWPSTDFLVVPVAGPPELNGTYLLKFSGEAQVEILFGYGYFTIGSTNYGGTLPSGAGYDPTTNTTAAELTLTPSGGINVFMNFTNTQARASAPVGSGISNIAMMRPVAPGSARYTWGPTLFNPALEARLAPFTTLRFMDYGQTNGSTIASWSDRTLPAAPIQAVPGGGALEYAVMLANETGKDLWLNIPVSADDDYVTKLARLLRYGSDGVNPYTAPQAKPLYPPLQPNLAVYLEYSNEVWNFGFSQASTNYNLAVAEVNAGGSPLNYDGSTNTYYWGWRRVAERAKEISDDFRAVWGDTAMGPRIRPVLEWQVGNGQDTADQQLSFLAEYYDNEDGKRHVATPHPVSYYLWGGGGAWYNSVANQDAGSLDGIFASGLVEPSSVQTDSSYAHTFGLRETAYEGGFEIGGDGPTSLQLSANTDPRAEAMTESALDYFFSEGGGLGLIYTIAGESAYGLANPTIYDAATPKLAAVAAVTSAMSPPLALGSPVAGATTVPATAADVAHDMWGPWGSTAYIGDGCWLNWTVNVTKPGRYLILTNLGAAPWQRILVDGNGIDIAGYKVTLSAGLHTIRVRNYGKTALAITGVSLTPD